MYEELLKTQQLKEKKKKKKKPSCDLWSTDKCMFYSSSPVLSQNS